MNQGEPKLTAPKGHLLGGSSLAVCIPEMPPDQTQLCSGTFSESLCRFGQEQKRWSLPLQPEKSPGEGAPGCRASCLPAPNPSCA